MDSDLAIIGGGPNGSLSAIMAASGTPDLQINVFEEHPEVGSPEHCSGLVAESGLKKLGLNIQKSKSSLVTNKIRKALFYSSNFSKFEIKRKNDTMLLLDRKNFDRYLAQIAKANGVNYNLNSQVIDTKYKEDHWKIKIKTGKDIYYHKTRTFISAEGIKPKVLAKLGYTIPNKNWIFPAVQKILRSSHEFPIDSSSLFFSRKYAPGFFSWVIPINDETIKIGVGIHPRYRGNTRTHIGKFIKDLRETGKISTKYKVLKTYGGFIPVTGPIPKTYGNNFMVTGDSAGLTKATTGGGVNLGGISALIAGEQVKKIHLEGKSSKKMCREYEERWKAMLYPDIYFMKILRRLLTPLNDDLWIRIIQLANDLNFGEKMENEDIDLHGLSLFKFALNPNNILKSINLIPKVGADIISWFL